MLELTCIFQDFVAVGDHVFHLMGSEDVCNDSPEVEDKSEVNEVTAPMPITGDGGVVLFRGAIMTCVLRVFLYHESRCISKLP